MSYSTLKTLLIAGLVVSCLVVLFLVMRNLGDFTAELSSCLNPEAS